MLQPMMHHVYARRKATCSEPVHKHIPTFLLPHATGAQISSSPVRTSKAAASRTRCIVREHRNQDWRRKKRRTTQQHSIVSPSSFHRDLCIMQSHPLAVLINPRRHPKKKKAHVVCQHGGDSIDHKQLTDFSIPGEYCQTTQARLDKSTCAITFR